MPFLDVMGAVCDACLVEGKRVFVIIPVQKASQQTPMGVQIGLSFPMGLPIGWTASKIGNRILCPECSIKAGAEKENHESAQLALPGQDG